MVVLAMTLYASQPLLLALLLAAPAAVVYVLPRSGTGKKKPAVPPRAAESGQPRAADTELGMRP